MRPALPRQSIVRLVRRLDDERVSLAVLLVAAAASVVLGLWLTRGATFLNDEFVYFKDATDASLRGLMEPFGGHLTAVHRGLTAVYLRVFGSDHVPFELTGLLLNAVMAVLLFKIVAARNGGYVALAASLPFLFLGSVPAGTQVNNQMWLQASVFGLAAFLLLRRRSFAWDLLACAALVLSVFSIEAGLAFALGAAAWILATDGPRRLWVPAIPLALYAAWWLWARQFDESFVTASNLLLVPAFGLDSAASSVAAYLGLGVDLIGSDPASLAVVDPAWGRVLLPVLAIAVALGLRRRGATPDLAAAVVMLISLWVMLGLGYGESRTPDSARYVLPVIIGLLLLASAAFAGRRPSTLVRLGLVLVLAVSLAGNLWVLRDRGARIRSSSDLSRVRLAAVELQPQGAIRAGGLVAFTTAPASAQDYLAAAGQFGGLGYDPGQLAALDPAMGAQADAALGRYAPPAIVGRDERCERPQERPAAALPRGGLVVRSGEGASLIARRFGAAPSVPVGTLPAGKPVVVAAPPDASARPWTISAAPGSFEVCANPPG